ncbi:hypothetical protein KR767_13325 [Luteibacter anthropi]|uniref:Uncharacterized protein n=1 Tax=Luteibacter anthropi TaxID=564369 RepID=A0A7X5UCG6_9GAMM|nr:hypothetical protein [Luteibacter anthropi]NII07772.1 hypothetical protein [Luteibacter anthropi]URX61066.1 hypothetical protein KR767_13325 [Luteibacter anthropi]
METPVHYRGYDILCSESGYTLLLQDVEVESVAVRDASGKVRNCTELADILALARRAVDNRLKTCGSGGCQPGEGGWARR